MITTQRSASNRNLTFERGSSSLGIDLLERETVVKDVASTVETADLQGAKERMRQNLDKLINYDRYSEEYASCDVKVEEKVNQQVEKDVVSINEDDIRPTSTTMQFGDIGADEIKNEMQSKTTEKTYKMAGKSKLVIALYAIVVGVVLALIVLNSGIISALNNQKATALATLSEKASQYEQLAEENEYLGSEERISDVAENEYEMIK